MNKETFILEVSKISKKQDFENNKFKVDNINKNDFENFINLLKIGGSISSSVHVLSIAHENAIKTPMTVEEFILNIPVFRSVIALLDLK